MACEGLYLRDHLLILCYALSVELSVFDGNVDYISHLLDRALSKCSTVLEKFYCIREVSSF